MSHPFIRCLNSENSLNPFTPALLPEQAEQAEETLAA